MGMRGRAFVEKDYSWRAIVARWLAEIGYRVEPAITEDSAAWLRSDKNGRLYT